MNSEKCYKGLFLSILILMSSFAIGQDYIYVKKTTPTSLLRLRNKELKPDLSSFVRVEQYFPAGYSKDGKIDYTAQIQKAINENINIIMPNFPVLINSSGLKLRSNSQIYFQSKSKIYLKPNGKDIYHMILLKNLQNVKIYNPVLVGDRRLHKSNKGEWGMGISIYSCSNIQLFNVDIRECWGDGIYLGREGNSPNNKDITISYAQLHENRRNGISVISGANILLDNIVVSNTHGALPMSGIVIEPNKSTDELSNIVIRNAKTFNNRFGILVYLKALQGNRQKSVDIKISGHEDQYSLNGVRVSDFSLNKNSKPIKGSVSISNYRWRNNKNSFNTPKNPNLPRVIVD